MSPDKMLAAFQATGQRLKGPDLVEILVVGGAALLLTNQASAFRTTSDIDILWVHPSRKKEDLYDAAEQVGRELALPASWMNDWGASYLEALPGDWAARRVDIGTFGRLRVYAAGRADLITMKFYARRPKDLEDLIALRPTADEMKIARAHLETLGDAALRARDTLHAFEADL